MTRLPSRLLESETDEFALAALRSAASDRGSEQAFASVLAAVTPPVSAPLAGPESAVRMGAGKLAGAPVALKGLAMGLAIGAGCLALANGLISKSRNAPDAANVAKSAASLSAISHRAAPPAFAATPAPTAAEPVAGPTSVSAEAKPISAARTRVRSATQPITSKASPIAVQTNDDVAPFDAGRRASQLALEVQLLDQARRELRAGDPAAALSTLDRRERDIALRALEPEAVVVRVEALLAAGQRERAARLAEQAITRNPTGAAAERLRRVLTKIQ